MLALERAKDGCAGARDRHIRAAERVDERRIVPALRSLVGRLHGGEIVLDILREYDFGAVLQMQFYIAEGEEDLKAMMNAPLELWRVYLHPCNRLYHQRTAK